MTTLHSDRCEKARNGRRGRPCICLASTRGSHERPTATGEPPPFRFPGRTDLPVLTPNARSSDPPTATAAGNAITADLSKIQRLVLRVYLDRGRLSARQAEGLAEFEGYGFSTIRKRISELAASGHLTAAGTESASGKTPSIVYRISAAETEEPLE